MQTDNESLYLEDELLKMGGGSEVWKKLSAREDLNWSSSLIDSYADQWDWGILCENESIPWNETLLKKYLNRIHWERLPSKTFNCFLHRSRMSAASNSIVKELDISSILAKLLFDIKCRDTFKVPEINTLSTRRINSQRDLLLSQLGLTPLASLEEVLEAAKECYYK